MKKAIFYFIAITIIISCKTKSDLSVEKFESPKIEQKIQKSYGAGGKIIYGTSEGSQGESSLYKYESKEEHNQTPPMGKEVDNKTKEKGSIKKIKKNDFGFSSLKVRPFSNRVTKSSKNYEKNSADKAAKAGFTFSLLALIIMVVMVILLFKIWVPLILFIVLLLFTIFGIIFSIKGLQSEKYKKLARIGLAISLILSILSFSALLIYSPY